jgi:putative membrane protein
VVPHFTDHAANERTYLAWIRTAISVMAFGFLLERFDIFLFYASRASDKAISGLHVRASEWLGLCLLLFGALLMLFATQRFYRNRRLIDIDSVEPYGGTTIERVMAGLLVLTALFLVVYVANQLMQLSA